MAIFHRYPMSPLRQQIDAAIGQQIQEALAAGALRRYVGPQTEALVAWLQAQFAASVLLTNSGTSALELALRASGVAQGDEIILSGYDYPGNFWIVEQLGCVPVLVDLVENSTRIDLNSLEDARSDRSRACIISHLHGQLQEIVQLREWANRYDIVLIEDACQSLGARLEERSIGTVGHFGLVSFSGSKVISAGRGGALITQDDKLFQKAKIASGAGSGAYGLSELSAAIVLAQLPFLETINNRCISYFASLCRAIEAETRITFLSDPMIFTNAYYQAGCIFSDSQHCSDALLKNSKIGATAGKGFPGFHRRSRRRCRLIGDLAHTASLVDRLLVIHHSVALNEQISSQQLAAEITGSIG